MANNEVDRLVKALKKQGIKVKRTRKNHWMVHSKDGEFVTILPGTPSDHRSLKNCMSYLKRAGYRP